MPSFQLPWISVSAFNLIRFLLISVILIPLFEASVANIFRIACALHLLRGKTAGWRESRLGYLSMHGKYYSRSSRALLYLISIASLAMYFTLESSSSAELHPQLSTVEVRKTVALESGNFDLETFLKLWRSVSHSSTRDLVVASLRFTGQRRGEVQKTALRKEAVEEVRNVTEYCFQRNENRINESFLQEWLDYLQERNAAASWEDRDLFKLENDFTSLYRSAYMGRDDSLLLKLESENLALHLKAKFYAIGRMKSDRESVEYMDGFYSRGTPLSSKEFVRRFGTLSMRMTVRRYVWIGHYFFSENRRFKCFWVRYKDRDGRNRRRGYTLCRLSILANRDGEFSMANILEEDQQWDDACFASQPNVDSGKCLSLLLRGGIVSNFDVDDDFTDVLLTDVLGSVEYNGRCVIDIQGELTFRGNAEYRNLLNDTSVSARSVETLRHLMTRPIALAEGEKAILRDGYETVRLPLSAKVVPIVNSKFIAIICTVALLIALQWAFVLILVFMNGMKRKRNLPLWVQLLITAQAMKVGDSFEYAARKATVVRDFENNESDDSNLQDEETCKSDRVLSLQRISGECVVAFCNTSATAWDYESNIICEG